LEPERKWQAWNYEQEQGYEVMAADSNRYHQELDSLIAEVIDLQKTKHLDLYEQEWRLLHELEYPFVNVHLNYYPSSLDTIQTGQDTTNMQWSQPRVDEASPTPLPDTPY